jgi:hypothetical protein
MLSPWKDEEIIRCLFDFLKKSKIDWERLLFMANLHYCTPLWFISMQRDELLPLLPLDLQIYLKHLYLSNLERQEAFQQAIREILSNAHDMGIPVILLKGAASFCDDLYNDKGARMMGDIDVLVKTQNIKPMKMIMKKLSYEEQESCFGKPITILASRQPHHLPRYLKPETPVAVEIHFETAHRGQASRVLPTEMSWANKEMKLWEGLQAFILNPTYRLLHNTVHTLLPNRAYTSSIIPLNHLVEFAYLVRRYPSFIDWRAWLMRGTEQQLNRQFRIYLTLAHNLMDMPFPKQVRKIDLAGLQVARISAAANNRANDLMGHENKNNTAAMRIKDLSIRIYIYLFYRLTKIAWDWQNLCYEKNFDKIPLRLFCLASLILKRVNLRRSFDNYKRLFRMFNRRLFL